MVLNESLMKEDYEAIKGSHKIIEELNSTVDVNKCRDILNNEIDWDQVDETGDVDFAIEQLRSLNTEGVITDDEYDYIIANWDELLDDMVTLPEESDKAKFDYAVIEFIEGGPDLDTESEKKLRDARNDQTHFTDLDALGDLIYKADQERYSKKDLNGDRYAGYDKCYVDFYGTYKGKEIKVHLARFDLGDGLGRDDHLKNDDISTIEEILTKEIKESDSIPITENKQLKEELHHMHDGSLDEDSVVFTIVVFPKDGEMGFTPMPKNADNSFDVIYFNTAEEAREYADKNYPDAYSVTIREDSWWDESVGAMRSSGPFDTRVGGKWQKQMKTAKRGKVITADEFREILAKKGVELDEIVNDWTLDMAEKELSSMTFKDWVQFAINTYEELDKDLTAEGDEESLELVKANEKEILIPLRKMLNESINMENKPLFTKEEQEEYEIDEDGNLLDGHGKFYRCDWCGEPTIDTDTVKEKNLGYLCSRCVDALKSRGERLTILSDLEESAEQGNKRDYAPLSARKPYKVFVPGDHVKYVNNKGWTDSGKANIGRTGVITDYSIVGNIETFTIKADDHREIGGYDDDSFLAHADNLKFYENKQKGKSMKLIKEEYGPYQGNMYLEEIADEVERGSDTGYIAGKKWELNIWSSNGDLDSTTLSSEAYDYVLEDVHYPIADGHKSYYGLDFIINSGSKDVFTKKDLETIGFDKEDIKKFFESEDNEVELETWIDYEIDTGDWDIDDDPYDEDDDIDYDRQAVEEEYGLDDGELDGVSIRDAEDMLGEEEGALDRFILNESKNLTESIDSNTKKSALAKKLGLDVNTIAPSSYDSNAFEIDGGQEFLVLDKIEARKYAVEDIKNVFDDLGLDSFTKRMQDWIIDHALDKDWFEEAMEESYQFYIEDIEQESDDVFENRLISEMVDANILIEDDFDNWGEDNPTLKDTINLDDKKYEFIEQLCDQDAIEWYKQNFGEKELSDLVRKGNGPTIDIDKVVEECISWDGVAHFIASYDEKELNLGNGLYAYRIN